MSWIKYIRLGLFILGTLLLLFSWQLKSFSALLSVTVVFLVLVATLVPRYQNISIPLIATGIIVVIAEIIFPFVLPDSQNLLQVDNVSSYRSGGYTEQISGFGYRPKPGVYSARKTTSEGDIIYDVVYTIGGDGYRLDVDDNDFDACIYGGSFAFGEGLNDNETLSFYLLQNHGIKTKNVGVHGYGLNHALYNIEQGLTSIDLGRVNVLLTDPWHSLRSSCKSSYAAATPSYETTVEGLKLIGVCSGGGFISMVLYKSNIIRTIAKVLHNENNIITDSDIDLYVAIIQEIARLSDENNARLIIAYIKAKDELLASAKWTNESLITELSNIGTVVDVTLAERREDLDQKYYIQELDQHPSALANQRRAEILQSFIRN